MGLCVRGIWYVIRQNEHEPANVADSLEVRGELGGASLVGGVLEDCLSSNNDAAECEHVVCLGVDFSSEALYIED